MVALKIWRVRHENQGENKKKVKNINPKVRWPYTLPMDAEVIEMTRMPTQKKLNKNTNMCITYMNHFVLLYINIC
jgi:hypothetical protein